MKFLSPQELNTPAVGKIIQLFDDEINKYRILNDHPEASKLNCGRIAELQLLKKIITSEEE